MVLWSDNTEEETMHGYPVERESDWDCEWDVLDRWTYSDVVVMDTNLATLKLYDGATRGK